MHFVTPRPDPKLNTPPRGLLHFDHDPGLLLAHVAAAGDALIEDQTRGRFAKVRDHDITGTAQVDVVRGMLRPPLGLECAPKGFVEGILIGLIQRDLAFPGCIGRAAQSGDKEMCEERTTDSIGLLS